MTYVSALRLGDGLRVGWREWISCGVCVVMEVGDWVHKYTLSLRKTKKDDQVIFVHGIVYIIGMRPVDWNVEGTVDGVSVGVVQEDGVVALCQQGHGSCNQDIC